MDHFNEITRTAVADVGDAGAVLDLSGDLVENILDVEVGLVGPAGHERRAVASAFFTAGNPHSEVENAPVGDLADPPLGVLVPLVAAVDDGVAGLHVVGEGGDGLVNGSAGLDEDNDGSGALDGEDEVAGAVLAEEGEIALVVGPIDGLVDLGGGAVVDGDGEAFLSDVEGEVLSHHGEAGQAYARQSWRSFHG